MLAGIPGILKWNQTVGDLFVCLSSQREAQMRQAANGWEFAVADRKQVNAVHLKSVWLDVDVKDKGYATTADAIRALGTFYTVAGLPAPTVIVGSGSGGLHVYWTFEHAITPDEWRPLAFALAEATRRHGFRCDTSCTVDSARILRVPGTFNHKSDPPTKVALAVTQLRPDLPVEVMRQALAPYMAATPGAVILNFPKRTGAHEDVLDAGMNQAPLIDLDQVATSCGFVRRALEENGASYGNPLWNLTTLAATFAQGQEADAHRMASGHPEYTYETTQALYERKVNEKAEKGLGWPSCASVQNAGCEDCAACPLRGLNKSPLHFGRAGATGADVTSQGNAQGNLVGLGADPDLPKGYFRDSNGFINHRTVSLKTGEPRIELVIPYRITDAWLQKKPTFLCFTVDLGSASGQKDVHLSLADHLQVGRDAFGRALGGLDIAANGEQIEALRRLCVAWVQKLQSEKDRVVSATPYGWFIENGKYQGFSYGNRLWFKGGDRPAVSPDGVLSTIYTPVGDLQKWIDAARITTERKRPELDAILATGFAGPLMAFTGQPGVVCSVFSTDSGTGKTTAMNTAAAVWGDWKHVKQGLDDTLKSAAGRMGAVRHLPIFWDEIKGKESIDQFVNFTFRNNTGRERTRMRSDTSQRKSGEWDTLLISANNDSIVDPVARATQNTTAGIYRLFEWRAEGVAGSPRSAASVDSQMAELRHNYGQAGLVYAQWLGENMDRVAVEVEAERERLERETSSPANERMWLSAMAALSMGARYANDLGLTEIDLETLDAFLIETLGRMRGQMELHPVDMKKSANVENILSHYLSAMRARHMLITDYVPLGAGKPRACLIRNDASKLDAIFVRYGTEQELVRLSSHHFRKWLQDHGHSPNIVCAALEVAFNGKRINGIITGGTPLAAGMGKEYLLELDLSGTPLGAGAGTGGDGVPVTSLGKDEARPEVVH
jgi:hypothetical protein